MGLQFRSLMLRQGFNRGEGCPNIRNRQKSLIYPQDSLKKGSQFLEAPPSGVLAGVSSRVLDALSVYRENSRCKKFWE